MIAHKQETYVLDNFEGPLDFLLQLIHKDEVDVRDVLIRHLIDQFWIKLMAHEQLSIEGGAEFIGMTSYLVWLKSQTLLPKREQEEILSKEEEDLSLEMLNQLLDYCRFKNVAKELKQRQEKQQTRYFRGATPVP